MSEVNYQELMNNTVVAVHALYGPSPAERKQEASAWLENLQSSVHAWKIADQLLHQRMDLNTCYFAAHTLRTKIQNSFQELPAEAHISLRDSLLSHVAAITVETDQIIVTQLCVAVADLILHMTSWADPIGHILNVFQGDTKHWWPLLEIFRVIPEEVYSRKLKLGDNRRNQLISALETASPRVYAFLRTCLQTCLQGTIDSSSCPVELCGIELVKCFGSWVSLNPECFCLTAAADADILNFAFMQLREGKCHWKMHTAATDCLCAVIEVLPNLESSSNNNTAELQSFQLQLYTLINSLEEAYHYAVAEEDIEKTLNYCRVFTEYAESMVPYMLRSWRDPHFSVQVINLVLLCAGHHDYEVAETTYAFWYQLSEDLYHSHDDSLNTVFRPYVYRFIECLYKHCKIEPDHEGPLNTSDDFYDFRKKTAELFMDLIFVVGYVETFMKLVQLLLMSTSWEDQEAALFLMHYTRKELKSASREQVWPVMERILFCSDWKHVCLKISALKFIGGMSEWIAANSELALDKSLQFLLSEFPCHETNNFAAAALQSVCDSCSEEIAARHLDYILRAVNHVDQYDVGVEPAVGLFRGVGHVLSSVPIDKLGPVARQICRAQLEPLDRLLQTQPPNDRSYTRNSKNDPVYWLNRLSGLFRSLSIPRKSHVGLQHPCKEAVCEDFWPVAARLFELHKADVRLMEQCCKSVRFAVRCIGKDASSFLSPLVEQLVNVYSAHLHSCCLYLASVLVDEFGSEPQCLEGLLRTLEYFIAPTFNVFSQPHGMRNHPDTVDDFFRLCTRYIQRCSIPFLKSAMIGPIIQCAIQASQIDHREANMGVMKFLYDLVHIGRKRDSETAQECSALVKSLMLTHGPTLISTILHAVVFELPTFTFSEISEFFFEMKSFMVDDFPQWFEVALKKLPNKTVAGNPATTIQQLQDFHKKVTTSRSPKELNKGMKEFTRLYR